VDGSRPLPPAVPAPPHPSRHADHQVCGGGRWCRGQDLPAHLVHNRGLPGRVRAHRLRQLQRADRTRRTHHRTQPVGHGR
ncbi:unnamed protein product, partial [Lampetra fluviatilis]